MLEEGKDYHFINFNNTDITGIELLMPEFLGVIYHYQKAGVVEEGDVARLKFGYTIIFPGEHDIDDLNSNEKFHTIMGDLIIQILLTKVDDETRNNDSEKPDIF